MVRAGCKVTVPFQFVQIMDSQKRLTYSAHRILQDDVFFRKLLTVAWSARGVPSRHTIRVSRNWSH
jgi:hypothetical protein